MYPDLKGFSLHSCVQRVLLVVLNIVKLMMPLVQCHGTCHVLGVGATRETVGGDEGVFFRNQFIDAKYP